MLSKLYSLRSSECNALHTMREMIEEIDMIDATETDKGAGEVVESLLSDMVEDASSGG